MVLKKPRIQKRRGCQTTTENRGLRRPPVTRLTRAKTVRFALEEPVRAVSNDWRVTGVVEDSCPSSSWLESDASDTEWLKDAVMESPNEPTSSLLAELATSAQQATSSATVSTGSASTFAVEIEGLDAKLKADFTPVASTDPDDKDLPSYGLGYSDHNGLSSGYGFPDYSKDFDLSWMGVADEVSLDIGKSRLGCGLELRGDALQSSQVLP